LTPQGAPVMRPTLSAQSRSMETCPLAHLFTSKMREPEVGSAPDTSIAFHVSLPG